METLTKTLPIMPTVRCAFINDGQLLMVKRSPVSKHNRNLWELPGGQTLLDGQGRPAETMFATARREADQEVHLDLQAMTEPDFIEVHLIDRGKHAGKLSLTLVGVALQYSGEPRIDHESSAFGWFNREQVYNVSDSITEVSRLAIADQVLPLLY